MVVYCFSDSRTVYHWMYPSNVMPTGQQCRHLYGSHLGDGCVAVVCGEWQTWMFISDFRDYQINKYATGVRSQEKARRTDGRNLACVTFPWPNNGRDIMINRLQISQIAMSDFHTSFKLVAGAEHFKDKGWLSYCFLIWLTLSLQVEIRMSIRCLSCPIEVRLAKLTQQLRQASNKGAYDGSRPWAEISKGLILCPPRL